MVSPQPGKSIHLPVLPLRARRLLPHCLPTSRLPCLSLMIANVEACPHGCYGAGSCSRGSLYDRVRSDLVHNDTEASLAAEYSLCFSGKRVHEVIAMAPLSMSGETLATPRHAPTGASRHSRSCATALDPFRPQRDPGVSTPRRKRRGQT